MRREVRLVLLCAMLLTALGACGRITHDIGQIEADNKKRDAGVTIPPDDTLDADRRDQETSNAGNAELPADAKTDGAVATDAEDANLAKDGDIRSGDGSDAPTSECAADSFEVEYEPMGLDIYVMMDALLLIGDWTDDYLGRWGDLTPQALTLWREVKPEIIDFLDNPESEGIGVGIKYFGQPDNDPPTPISCDPDTYEQAKVEIAQLPANAEALKDSFPSYAVAFSLAAPALQGAINHAKSRVQANPGRKQIVFLMVGSLAFLVNVCDSDRKNLEEIAARGFADSIATYVIGIYSLENYEKIVLKEYLSGAAVQGGAPKLYLASLSSEKPEVALKLEEARDAAKRSACRFSLFPEDQNRLPDAIDPDLAKIIVTKNDNTTSEIRAVQDHSYCSQDEMGWHFDDPLNPSSLVACERTCYLLSSEEISRLELRLDCPN